MPARMTQAAPMANMIAPSKGSFFEAGRAAVYNASLDNEPSLACLIKHLADQKHQRTDPDDAGLEKLRRDMADKKRPKVKEMDR
ncbi:MAG: hypothetical protein Q9226_004776, partial [Calogaya cf. arnoldii]